MTLAFLAGAASAAQRAYVASHGNDTNAGAGCTLPAPCRSFAAALGAVDAGGEIVALDAAGYGAVKITKSVTITANPGYFAGIAASSGYAVWIDAPGGRVVLRNLSINGIGALHGVVVDQTTSLSIENCEFSNFGVGDGTAVRVNSPAVVNVTDSVFRASQRGIALFDGARATVARSTFFGLNDVALYASSQTAAATYAYVSDSVFNNSYIAIQAAMTAGAGAAKVWVTRSTSAGNGYGVAATTNATGLALVHLSGSTVVRNDVGYLASGVGAAVESAGNNVIRDNPTNSGTFTSVGLQ